MTKYRKKRLLLQREKRKGVEVIEEASETGLLLGAGVLGHGLGALGHCVLGQLSGQQEPDGRLDLARRDGRPLVVVGQAGRLGRDPLEEVVDEAGTEIEGH